MSHDVAWPVGTRHKASARGGDASARARDRNSERKHSRLLPKLLIITIFSNPVFPRDRVQFCARIAPSTLEEITLNLRESAAESLPVLAASCPEIQRITFYIDPYTVNFTALVDTIALWRRLRAFALRFVSSQDPQAGAAAIMDKLLRELSTLPALDDLTIDVLPAVSNRQLQEVKSKSERPFLLRHLRRLHVTSSDAGLVPQMLNDISSPSLRALQVTSRDASVFTILEPSIRSLTYIRDLQKLKVEYVEPQNDQRGIYHQRGTIALRSALRDFTHMHRLRELSLGICNVFKLSYAIETTDADWEACLPSWPHLQRLEIIDGNFTTVRPTMRTLALLAQYCPALESINMTVKERNYGLARPQMRVDPSISAHPADPTTALVHTHLTHLRLRHSTFAGRNRDDVAQEVARMFPRLRQVTRIVEVPLPPLARPGPANRYHPGLQQDSSRFIEVAWKQFMRSFERRRPSGVHV